MIFFLLLVLFPGIAFAQTVCTVRELVELPPKNFLHCDGVESEISDADYARGDFFAQCPPGTVSAGAAGRVNQYDSPSGFVEAPCDLFPSPNDPLVVHVQLTDGELRIDRRTITVIRDVAHRITLSPQPRGATLVTNTLTISDRSQVPR